MKNTIEEQLNASLSKIHESINHVNLAGLHTEYRVNKDTNTKQLVIVASVVASHPESAHGKEFSIPKETDFTYVDENGHKEIVKIPIVIRISGAPLAQALDKKVRPCPGGYQITIDDDYGMGTLGVNILYEGVYRLLSCAHVIAPEATDIGKKIYQPTKGWGILDDISSVTGRINVIEYSGSGPIVWNDYDFAWSNIEAERGADFIALTNTVPTGFRKPIVGEEIVVVGKQSAKISKANILSIASTLYWKFYKNSAYFQNLIQLDKLVTVPGDSGAVYVASSDNAIVGMHCAATATNSYGCHIP